MADLFADGLNQIITFLQKDLCDQLADFCIIDSFFQIIPGRCRRHIVIKSGIYIKILPSFLFLGKDTMIGKNF